MRIWQQLWNDLKSIFFGNSCLYAFTKMSSMNCMKIWLTWIDRWTIFSFLSNKFCMIFWVISLTLEKQRNSQNTIKDHKQRTKMDYCLIFHINYWPNPYCFENCSNTRWNLNRIWKKSAYFYFFFYWFDVILKILIRVFTIHMI